MNTHITKSTVAAFALALVTNILADNPVVGAPEPSAAGKDGKAAPAAVADAQAEKLDTVTVSLTYEAFSLPIKDPSATRGRNGP